MADEAVMELEQAHAETRDDETPDDETKAAAEEQAAVEAEQRSRRKRLQIELSEAAFQRLNELVSESQAESVADFARSAIRFYAFFLEHKRRGYKLMLARDVKDFEVLEL